MLSSVRLKPVANWGKACGIQKSQKNKALERVRFEVALSMKNVPAGNPHM
jgi:hypothetical protein